jgi:hypothetical protein
MIYLEYGVLNADSLMQQVNKDEAIEYTQKLNKEKNTKNTFNHLCHIIDIVSLEDPFMGVVLYDGIGQITGVINSIKLSDTFRVGSVVLLKCKFVTLNELLCPNIQSQNYDDSYVLSIEGYRQVAFVNNKTDNCSVQNKPKRKREEEETIELSDSQLSKKTKYDDEEKKDLLLLDQLLLKQPQSYVNTVGLIYKIGEIEEVECNNQKINKRNFTIVDKSKTKIMVAVWGKQAEKFKYQIGDVIMFINILFVNYNGASLSVTKGTYIKIVDSNTTIKHAKDLYDWSFELRNKKTNKKSRKN